MNELEQFLSTVDTEQPTADALFQPETAPAAEPEKEPEDEDLKPRNRRERRQAERLERERNATIQLADQVHHLNERIETMSKAKDSANDADYFKGLEMIYGNETPEAIQATELLKKAIRGASEEARQQALQEFQIQQTRDAQAVAEAEEELDTMLDELEDRYGVELTEEQETAYFQLMQRMSPKDRNGNVAAPADPEAVWEVFTERMSRTTDNRAKELAARSMTQSGSSIDSTLQDDALGRYLRKEGII